MKNADKKALFGLCTGHFMVDWYASVLVPLYPVITAKLGISLSFISAIIAFGHMFSSMLQPAFGYVSDKLKHRTFMFWGLVMSSVFIPLTVVSHTPELLTLFLIFGMCGNAFYHPQVTCLVNTFSYNNPKLTKYMGVFLGLGTIGYAIGPVCSSGMVQGFGENSLLFFTIPGILTALFIYFVVPKIPQESLCGAHEKFLPIMKEILSSKAILGLILISVVKSGVSISFGTYMPFILEKNGFTLSQIGLIVTLFFTISGFATMISSKIEEKIGGANVIRLSFFSILPLTLLFLYVMDKMPLVSAILFVLTGFFILLSVSVTLVSAQKIMSTHKGVISGVMQGFSWGLGALFLAPMGLIGQHFGVEKILIIMSLIAFLTGVFGISKDLKRIFENGVQN